MFNQGQHGIIRNRPTSTGVNRLALLAIMCNTRAVPDKEGAGFDDLTTQKRTNGAMPFFYVCMSSCVLNGRRWRGSLRACWFSFVYQFVNPVICRPPPFDDGGRLYRTQEDYTMPRYASTTPTNSRIALIKRLSSQASAISALLSVFDVLTADGQQNALIDCHERASDVAIDLSALIGGAA